MPVGKLDKKSFWYTRMWYTLPLVNLDRFPQHSSVTDTDETEGLYNKIWSMPKAYLKSLPLFFGKTLRLNLIENWTISVLSGQKSGMRIILSILQSFVTLLKAKNINSCLKYTSKTISHGN